MAEQRTKQINLTVLDDNNFLSPYSETQVPVVASDVADFLENSAKQFHFKDKLHLNIHTNCVDEQEQQLYPEAIHNYFQCQLVSLAMELRRTIWVGTVFVAIGLVALICMILFAQRGINEIWVECIDIFAWVFLWEAVDQLFIQRSILARRKRRVQNFCEMTVEFLPYKAK